MTAPVTAPSPWIVRAAFDLPLVVLTPLLALPLLWMWRDSRGDEVVYATVMTFGALGHHLPGMLRAYGDRALFARFRSRFLLAPLFLIAVCAGWRIAGLHAVAILALSWGIWHGFMQTYGFARIYDGKRGSVDKVTARIDFAACAVFFVGAVVISPYRNFQLLAALADCGVEAPSAATLALARQFAVVLMAATLCTHMAWSWHRTRRGTPPSALKHLFLASSFGLWWIATNAVPSLLFGLALFEIFHDIQYLAIVWAFNRRRAQPGSDSGAFTRFLFGGGALGAGLYVGLVAGYGALGPLAEEVGAEKVRDGLAGVLAASQLLHFYFDGFIWKVREAKTRANLGITVGQDAARERRGMAHLGLWALFVLPLGVLTLRETDGGGARSFADRSLAEAMPDDAAAQSRLGLRLAAADRAEEALPALRRAHQLDPTDPSRRTDLARTLAEAAESAWIGGRSADARALLEEAVATEPEFNSALRGLVKMRIDQRDADGALRAIDLQQLLSTDPALKLDRARVLAAFGRDAEALVLVREVRASEPSRQDAAEMEAALLRRSKGR